MASLIFQVTESPTDSAVGIRFKVDTASSLISNGQFENGEPADFVNGMKVSKDPSGSGAVVLKFGSEIWRLSKVGFGEDTSTDNTPPPQTAGFSFPPWALGLLALGVGYWLWKKMNRGGR